MPDPRNTTVSIDGNSFNALSTHVGLQTVHDYTGMPSMGSASWSITCIVDANDNTNLPFSSLQSIWDLANIVTRDKVKDIVVNFWTDESQNDVICTFTFQGWISSVSLSGGSGSNHTLSIQIRPALDQKQYATVTLGN